MSNKEVVIGGIYRHYKGPLYRVVNFAMHTETSERLVLYRSVDAKVVTTDWARPEKMWFETVHIDIEPVVENGELVVRRSQPRFVFEGMALTWKEKEVEHK